MFLSLTISADILKCKTIFSKKRFYQLRGVDLDNHWQIYNYCCAFINNHENCVVYNVFALAQRQVDNKIYKNFFLWHFRHRRRTQFFIKLMIKNFDALTNIACLNIRFHLLFAEESKIFSLNQTQNLLSFKMFWRWIIMMFFNKFFSVRLCTDVW